MFAKEWANITQVSESSIEIPKYEQSIKTVAPLMWGEHCMECAVPECYHYCELYEAREDGRCKLFKNGIAANKAYKSVSGTAVDITFKKWGKLEAFANVGQTHLKGIQTLDALLTSMAKLGRNIEECLPASARKWRLTNMLYKIREGIVLVAGKRAKKPEALLVGIINQNEPFKLMIEVKTLLESKFRTSIMIEKGYNQYVIPYEQLNITYDKRHYIYIYPEVKDQETTMTITALDLVTFKEPLENIIPIQTDAVPAEKIKCVVWDLDETMWSGILIESKPEDIKLKEETIACIKALDERGILNAICSKNDYDTAYEMVKTLGIEEYFVNTKINWNPKSVNIQNIATELNIGIDTFAFVDDSPFERKEVSHTLPMVRCFDVTEVPDLLGKPEFDIPITQASKERRHTYQMLAKRKQLQDEWTGNIDDFLRSCQMTLTLGTPFEHEVMRCFELLQRTNQLNISGRRLALEQVESLIQDQDTDTYVMKCKDNFGEYGIVGFVVIDRKETNPTVTDLVISCRVANKKVEHSLLLWLAERYKVAGAVALNINYKPSKKNGPLSRVFQDLSFSIAEELEEHIIYTLDLTGDIQNLDIVQVSERMDTMNEIIAN